MFDAVLVSHEPGVLDALDLVEGLRGGGNDEPMIVLGARRRRRCRRSAYEVGADAYCCVAETTTRSLLWTFARAIERCQLVREHRRLVQIEQQRLAHEHQEAERLLAEQRALIAELEKIRDGTSGETWESETQRRRIVGCSIERVRSDLSPSRIRSPYSALSHLRSSRAARHPLSRNACGRTS